MAQIGDEVYLGTKLINMSLFGIVTGMDTPSGMSATLEVVGDNGALTIEALKGDKGDKGEPSPIVDLQYGSTITDPGQLPTSELTPADRGKAWWVGNQVYVWTGTEWMVRAMGTQGRPGPVPMIDPTIESISWEEQQAGETTSITVGGSDENPTWKMRIAAPRGPVGPSTNLRGAPDYDNTLPPTGGQVIAWNNTKNKFEPVDPNPVAAKFYSVPEGAFTNFSGIAQRQTIAYFDVPPQPFDWVPHVTGHIRASGVELDKDPLIIGSEVRLGNAMSGQLVSRGFGNNSTWTTFVPHFSTSTQANDAVTPDGATARVPANHSGTAGRLYVNLYNDGLAGLYNFDKQGAQLSVMVIPV